jgi:signal transduction histidine kinase
MTPFFVSPQNLEKEVSRRVAEACDQITSEMGAEIHDDLIQKLSVFRLYLDRLERSVNDPPEIERLLIGMRTDFENVTQSIRRISRQLMPVHTGSGSFEEEVQLLAQNMERPGAGNIHLSFKGKEEHIAPVNRLYILRIIQELIHNAFKHSAAWHVWVRSEWSHDMLIVEVEDDGTGFHKISEFIERLRRKNNTLKMRSQTLGAPLTYHQGQKGLLARLEYSTKH